MAAPTTSLNLYDIMKNSIQDSKFQPLLNFIKLHSVEKQEDMVGNGDDIYNASNIEYIKRFPNHGFDDGQDKEVYNAVNPDGDEYHKEAYQTAKNSVRDMWNKYSYENKNRVPQLRDD